MDDFSLKDILAVVVIYNTNFTDCITLSTINANKFESGEKIDFIVYDNSHIPQNPSSLLEYSNLNCEYFFDTDNPGVSKAYNYGASQAIIKNKKYILLLDQDTKFPNDSLLKYLSSINSHKDSSLFCPILKTNHGIYSPSNYYFRRGTNWKDAKPGIYSLKNKSALNSGLLVNVSSYLLVGGYNEKIKLYFSDFDFINRFRTIVNQVVVIDLVCWHSLSDIDKTDLLSAISRFRHYVNGAYYSIYNFVDWLYTFITILLRAIKLSFKFRNFLFVKIFFSKFIFNVK